MSDSKAGQRLRTERRNVATTERQEPLRRRLLLALGDGSERPTELARALGKQKEQISRALNDLQEAGFVAVTKGSDDRRQRIYSLTKAGRAELGRHLVFGEQRKRPVVPSPDERAAFRREALAGAIQMRRRHNRLEEAIDRIKEIHAQAEAADDHECAIEALAELAATQRQARKRRERNRSVALLEELAMGKSEIDSQLVFPVIAHLEYERGKADELGDTDAPKLAGHLIASMSLFEALVQKSPQHERKAWLSRQAWSLVGLTNTLQSSYEDSLRYAACALRIFDELDDDYGRAQCWLDFGFGLRQMHRFDAAWNCLERAHELATTRSNGFERALANCLVQQGEVRRCQGKTDEAKQLLEDALDAARRLELIDVRAFATSGLAAVDFQRDEFDQAQETLRSAQKLFERCRHPEGTALNARRQATVARHLSYADVEPDEAEVKRLIDLSEKTYRSLNSPAGVAACEVERGWMRKKSPQCGDLDEIVQSLLQLVKSERRTLQRDAWVPQVLRNFANEVDGDLAKEAKAVYTAAKLCLREEWRESVQRISELSGDLDKATESRPSIPVIEMGGASSRNHEFPLPA